MQNEMEWFKRLKKVKKQNEIEWIERQRQTWGQKQKEEKLLGNKNAK